MSLAIIKEKNKLTNLAFFQLRKQEKKHSTEFYLI